LIFDGIKGGFFATTSLIAKYGGVSGKKGPFLVGSPDAGNLCWRNKLDCYKSSQPNATRQARLKAGAQRTLEAVACTR
jgi:hypothetical protein